MLSFISRASHDEVVNMLRSEIADLKAERKMTLDYILRNAVGNGLFEDATRPVPVATVIGGGYFAKPTNEPTAEELDAQQPSHPRQFLRNLQRDVNEEAAALIRDTVAEGQAAAE